MCAYFCFSASLLFKVEDELDSGPPGAARRSPERSRRSSSARPRPKRAEAVPGPQQLRALSAAGATPAQVWRTCGISKSVLQETGWPQSRESSRARRSRTSVLACMGPPFLEAQNLRPSPSEPEDCRGLLHIATLSACEQQRISTPSLLRPPFTLQLYLRCGIFRICAELPARPSFCWDAAPRFRRFRLLCGSLSHSVAHRTSARRSAGAGKVQLCCFALRL